jgi:hypothetical protein
MKAYYEIKKRMFTETVLVKYQTNGTIFNPFLFLLDTTFNGVCVCSFNTMHVQISSLISD